MLRLANPRRNTEGKGQNDGRDGTTETKVTHSCTHSPSNETRKGGLKKTRHAYPHETTVEGREKRWLTTLGKIRVIRSPANVSRPNQTLRKVTKRNNTPNITAMYHETGGASGPQEWLRFVRVSVIGVVRSPSLVGRFPADLTPPPL